MPGQCVVALAGDRFYPYREPDVLAGHRRRLLRRATGAVLDLSVTWANNQACYLPGGVASVHVLTPVQGSVRPPEWADDPIGTPLLLAGPPPPASFDTVVATLALCDGATLDVRLPAIASWLRPGGHLLALEHVCGVGLTGIAQRMVSAVTQRSGATCRLDQDLAAGLRTAGFELTDAARFTARLAGGIPIPCMAAVARTPLRPGHTPEVGSDHLPGIRPEPRVDAGHD